MTKSLLKEFVNQTDLKKSDGSDAGKTDVSSKAPANDVKFSLMRNTINSDGRVTGSDVANYLEKAHDINDEVDTVVYGLETSDGEVVKVYVNASQADAFEAEMKKMLGMEDDIEEAINDLATRFDIVDVVWPKGQGPDDEDDNDVDLENSASIGDPDADAERVDPNAGAAEEDENMEVIASADDLPPDDEEEEPPDSENKGKKSAKKGEEKASDRETSPEEAAEEEPELDADGNPIKKTSTKRGEGDRHTKLKNIGKNMKTEEGLTLEGKLQPGWYVQDADDKMVAGPTTQEKANEICKAKGASSRGLSTMQVSDEDAQEANESTGDTMTLGNKFLQRYLSEDQLSETEKEDRDGVLDAIDIPMDTQQRALANKLKWRLPKQIVQLFAMMGIPGVKLNSAGAETSIAEAAEMLRSQLSVRRAFLDFFKAYGAMKGYSIAPMKTVREGMQIDEVKLKRGNYLQKQLETVLVKLGLPEDLVSTTGPGVVGSALYRASKDIEEDADLKAKLRMLAIRMGIKPGDAMAPLKGEEVTEGIDPAGADMYADAVMGFVAAMGVPDAAFNRQARTIIAKEFRNMRTDVNVSALLNLVKRYSSQFAAAKARVTRAAPQGQAPQGTTGTV